MMHRYLASLALIAFIALALMGLMLPFTGHAAHDDCLLSFGDVVVCQVSLSHLAHWQDMFLVLTEVLLIVVLARAGVRIAPVSQWRATRLRTRPQSSERPLLFQELCSDGLLHPRPF